MSKPFPTPDSSKCHDYPRSIFFLGATGYLGGQVLKFLADLLVKYPSITIHALMRSPEKLPQLQALVPDTVKIVAIKGTLDDVDMIKEEASRHPIVINTASSDHPGSVEATLQGLKSYSTSHPNNPPLYIHTSGQGFTSDNCRGQPVSKSDLKVYTDIGLDLEAFEGFHLDCDRLIARAGNLKDKDEQAPIRTVIVFPPWIYGVSDGPQKVTLPLRMFLELYKDAGLTHAGTWGPGANRMNNCHVKDVANAYLLILEEFFKLYSGSEQSKLELGKEGLYFLGSENRALTMYEVTSELGKILHKKGILKSPESKPLSEDVLSKWGEYGWSLLGGNLLTESRRMKRLGWKAEVSEKMSLVDCMEEEVFFLLKAEEWTSTQSPVPHNL